MSDHVAPSLRLPTVILAGGKAQPELEAIIGTADRSQAIVAGKTLLVHVLDAVRTGNNSVLPGSIAVVGTPPPSPHYTCIPDTGDFVGNLFAGLHYFREAPYVLVATSDLPFVTGDSVAQFVQEAFDLAQQQDADIVWPVVPVELCYSRYPGVRRTALKLREGHYTGGNLALIRPGFMLHQRDRMANAFIARKSPLLLARMLGIETVARLLLSQKLAPHLLTLPYLESRVGTLLGGRTSALIVPLPELATDLDRPSDFLALQ